MEIIDGININESVLKSDLDFPLSFRERKYEKRNYIVNWVDIENIYDAINTIIFKYKEVSNYDKFY